MGDLSGRNRTVTVTFSMDRSASGSAPSAYSRWALLRAEDDAGEFWPSVTAASGASLDDDVVEEEGEQAAAFASPEAAPFFCRGVYLDAMCREARDRERDPGVTRRQKWGMAGNKLERGGCQ